MYISICAGFCQHWKHLFPNRMRTKKPKQFSSSNSQISSNKFKAPTNSSSNIQISSNKFKSPSNKIKSPPTNSKLQHSNLQKLIQSSNIQISSNKLKAPTFESHPTNSKLQQTLTDHLERRRRKGFSTCTSNQLSLFFDLVNNVAPLLFLFLSSLPPLFTKWPPNRSIVLVIDNQSREQLPQQQGVMPRVRLS